MTRQYRWQLKKKEQGLCVNCGRRKIYKSWYCKECHIKKLQRRRKRYRNKK